MSHPVEILLPCPVAGFDVLAAAVLAHRLYPASAVVRPERLRPSAKSFLALHKDRFPLRELRDVDFGAARRVVLVGLRHAAEIAVFSKLAFRVEAADPDLELHVIDHRRASPEDVAATLEIVEPVGALTTLVVEALEDRGIDIDVEEATLGALGIHERTRSLTAGASTSRDAKALAWLLDRGASLRVLNRYSRPVFKVAQRTLLGKLLGRFDLETMRGVDVGIAEVPLDRPIEGVVDVLDEVLRLEAFDAVFTIHPCDDHVLVAGASRTAQVNVKAALEPLGAREATSQRGSILLTRRRGRGVRDTILEALVRQPSSRLLVRDVMSSPVRCVTPNVSIRLLRDSLRSWRHHGVPVLADGAVVGVVSQRDVERAERDGVLGEKVASIMSREVRSIEADATLEEALELMSSADVGRLPVLRERRLVGIVSRADVLRRLYPSKSP